MKKNFFRFIALFMAFSIVLPCCALSEAAVCKLDPKLPQTLMIWHYYNGVQQQLFDQLVLEFNETVGAQQGIIVEAHSQGSVNDLATKVLASANHEVGASEMPEIFAAYADTAYQINNMGLVADLSPYLTAQEQSAYMDAYIREGQLNEEGVLKVFPTAKSTELLLMDLTDWNLFAHATGADEAELSTWEGIVRLAKRYYEYTDALTEAPGDGKAFFGRDALANYLLIGSLQLGTEMFAVQNGMLNLNIDDAVMRRLWDNYYVPYVNGWFGAYGRFRSDDVKTGQIIALVGSTSGAPFFPTEVTRDDGTTYPIESKAFLLPNFEGTQPYAVQQGAGMVVTKSTTQKEYSATVFLKWFTQEEHNIEFAINSGYLPVKKAANNPAALRAAMDAIGVSDTLRSIMNISVQITHSYTLYTNNAFSHGYEARKVVENHMADAADAAVRQRDEMIADGMSREDAIAQLTGDEAFNEWLVSFKDALNASLEP